MRLNAQTDFSLRIMMFLASCDGSATISEIAAKLQLSKDHTMRIVAKLVSRGLIRSTRGRTGGLSLARGAESITVADVVIAIEPDFDLVHCLQSARSDQCSIETACRLKGALSSALEAFFAELRAVTLSDLVLPNKVQLAQIFRLGEPTQIVRCRVRGKKPAEPREQVGGAY